ncbi:MAG: oligoendopeptidase F family protein, partial [Malacoplasma sp.]|nr:oligoendopeptidase F family protein [Malacoplasma sp.]
IQSYLKDKELTSHKRGYDLIFRSEKHILKPEIEKVLHKLSVADGGVGVAFTTLTDSDLKFKPAKDSKNKEHEIKTASDASLLLKNSDRTLRKNTWINFHSAYDQYENTLAQTLYYTYLDFNATAKVYNFKDYVDSTTFADEIDESFILNLYKNVESFKDVYRKYKEKVALLLKKQLKLKELEPWDMSMDLSKTQIKVNIETAKKMVLEGLKPLGKDYCSHIKEAFNNNWISWLPKENKLTGAYSIGGVKGLDKYYILTNFNNTIDAVMTIAHELGHSMNSYYSVKNQKVYTETSIFYAEIASICVETLMILYFLKKYSSKKDFVNLYLKHLFDNFFGSTTRQIVFSNFEYEANKLVNKGHPFVPKALKELYLNLLVKYEGWDHKKVAKYRKHPYSYMLSTILRIPHFYAGNFYVYKYAIGQICGLIMANKIYKGDKKAVNNFIKFLSSGSSLPPLDTVKLLGIDLTREEPYKEAKEILLSLIKKFS